jgi:ribosome maturation factor RimP
MRNALQDIDTVMVEEELAGLLERVLAGSSIYLVRVAVRGRSGSRVVEAYVDSDDGVTVDQCADVSHRLGLLIDAKGLLEGGYRLSVSSPGVDRPLELPRQYRRHIGRPIRITVAGAEGEESIVSGRLVDADESSVTLDVQGSACRIAMGDIVRAKIELPW